MNCAECCRAKVNLDCTIHHCYKRVMNASPLPILVIVTDTMAKMKIWKFLVIGERYYWNEGADVM